MGKTNQVESTRPNFGQLEQVAFNLESIIQVVLNRMLTAFCILAYLVSPGTGYRHTVQGYDYVSDNLADDFVILNRRNALIIK